MISRMHTVTLRRSRGIQTTARAMSTMRVRLTLRMRRVLRRWQRRTR